MSEDAVAKAKAIAAKLSGQLPPPTNSADAVNPLDIARAAAAAMAVATGGGGEKRKRWGTVAEEDTSKKTKFEAQKRLWISTKEKPASHFRLFWEAQGDEISKQVSRGTIGLQLLGKGSSKVPALPGIPEEPLHLLIQGPTLEECDGAEQLVETLFVAKAEQAPTMVDDISNDPNASSAAAGIAGYTPASVASMIHTNGVSHDANATMLEEQISVPNGVVGFIIGRGGESIASMQAKTNCKVQIQKEAEMNPGQTHRLITLLSTSKDNIDACRTIINGMVRERAQSTSREFNPQSNSQESRLQEAVTAGHQLVTVKVPDSEVGLIIGKGGSTIKGIQDRSGANIQIPQTGDADDPQMRTVSITHPSIEGANTAKQLIEEILGSKRNQVAHTTMQINIPDKDVGMCIGRAGCVIKAMQQLSNCKIQIPNFATPGTDIRVASVVGPEQGCLQVKQFVERISLEQSSQSIMSMVNGNQQGGGYGGQQQGGHYGGGYGQQQQQGGYSSYGGQGGYGQQQQQTGYQNNAYGQQQQGQQAGGQQDYSKEWAAYYAQQAAQGGAAAGQAATPAPAPVAAAPAAQAPASAGTDSTYHEQFFRYAYYYGDDAARKHYGDYWSPTPGTPNPYGVNPSGITPAPAQGADSAPAATPAAPAPAPQANIRDSGRRGVSNLPAWMTKQQG